MTRETFYVAMTRGREQNIAYVAVDKPDPRPTALAPATTPRRQPGPCCSGCCSTSVPSCRARDDHCGAGHLGLDRAAYRQYGDPGLAAQHDRWAALVRSSGLSDDDAEDASPPRIRGTDCRAPSGQANQRDVETLLPRLDTSTRVRGRRRRRGPPLPSCPRDRQASGSRACTQNTTSHRGPHPRSHRHHAIRDAASADRATRDLIEARADLSSTPHSPRNTSGSRNSEPHPRLHERPRHGGTPRTPSPPTATATASRTRTLGAPAEAETQKIDVARARAALDRTRSLEENRTAHVNRPATTRPVRRHAAPERQPTKPATW